MNITKGMLSGVSVHGIKINTSKRANSTNYANVGTRAVNYIVMHYTGNSKDTAKANANYFQGAGRGASAHFFVDNNEIYQSVELRDRAWHCGGSSYYHAKCRNTNAFGIEMCTSGNYKVSSKTKENAAYLCAYLCKMLGITASKVDTYVLRHYDVTHKSCPAQMAGSNNAEWNNFKTKVKNILNDEASKTNGSFKVKVICDDLNIRTGPGVNYDAVDKVERGEVFTIVEVKANTWGKLKSGAGWINTSSKYCEKV